MNIMREETSKVSVVIINWNARKYIGDCIASVLHVDYPSLEIILVDNASTDGSIEELKKYLGKDIAKIRLFVNDKNYGAAYALNLGAKNAKGKYIAFIASDTKVDKNCFNEIVKIMDADPAIGVAESKLLLMNNRKRFDHAGEYLSQYGFLIQRHAGKEIDYGQFDYVTEIFSGKGTALTVKKEVFFKVEGYDANYFMFLEETDFCWRVWLSGYRVVFVPTARIYHASGVSIRLHKQSEYLAKYYGSRNYITTLFKNLGRKNLMKILPTHVFMWFLLALWLILNLRIKAGFYIIEGILWNIANFREILRKRQRVQAIRIISDKYLFSKIMRRINLFYLFDRVNMW